jgi:hypothetical protein
MIGRLRRVAAFALSLPRVVRSNDALGSRACQASESNRALAQTEHHMSACLPMLAIITLGGADGPSLIGKFKTFANDGVATHTQQTMHSR